MTFVGERETLLAAVAALTPFAGRGAVATIAAAEPDRVTVTVADAGGGARVATLARILLAGRAAVPFHPLAKALRCAAGSRVEVAAGPAATVLVLDPDGTAPRKFTFTTADPGAEPDCPALAAGAVTAELPADDFARLVHRCAFVAHSRAAPAGGWAVDGVQLTVGAGRVGCAGTDMYRLALASAPAETTGKAARTVLIPVLAARAWAGAARTGEGVRVTATESGARFRCGPVEAWCPALDGTFPAWAVPELPHRIAVPAERLRAEIAVALTMADAEEPRLVLTTRPGGLVVAAVTGHGRVEVVVPVPGFAGPAVALPLDGRRLLACLTEYGDAHDLSLAFDSGTRPVLLTAGDCRCLMAPMVNRESVPRPARATA